MSALGADLQPDRLVTAEDLARDGVAFPAFYGDDMLLPAGKTPAYLGHAVAILIYKDFARFRFAKDKLKFQETAVKAYPFPGVSRQHGTCPARRACRARYRPAIPADACASCSEIPAHP